MTVNNVHDVHGVHGNFNKPIYERYIYPREKRIYLLAYKQIK